MDLSPPLTWTIHTSELRRGPVERHFEATAGERAAVATYLGVSEISDLRTDLRVTPLSGERFRARGTVAATLSQESVVSLEPVEQTIEEPFSVEFWPPDALRRIAREDDEPEDVSLEDEPPEPIEENRLSIGRLTCELLSVAVDPFPRMPGEEFRETGAADNESFNPFSALKKLRQEGSGG